MRIFPPKTSKSTHSDTEVLRAGVSGRCCASEGLASRAAVKAEEREERRLNKKKKSKSVTVGFQTASTGSSGGWPGCAIKGWFVRATADRARPSDHKTHRIQARQSQHERGGCGRGRVGLSREWSADLHQGHWSFKQNVFVLCQKRSESKALSLSELSSPCLHCSCRGFG